MNRFIPPVATFIVICLFALTLLNKPNTQDIKEIPKEIPKEKNKATIGKVVNDDSPSYHQIIVPYLEEKLTEKINEEDAIVVCLVDIVGCKWHLKKEIKCCGLTNVVKENRMNKQGDFSNYTKFNFIYCSKGVIEFECYKDIINDNDTKTRIVRKTFTLALE